MIQSRHQNAPDPHSFPVLLEVGQENGLWVADQEEGENIPDGHPSDIYMGHYVMGDTLDDDRIEMDRPIARTRADERQPFWAPDGRAGFISDRNGQSCLYLGKAGQKRPDMLVDADALDAKFSPDGKTIAYIAANKSDHNELWRAHADGTHAHRIDTRGLEPCSIQFAPDGKSLVFSTFGNYNKHDEGLYVVQLDSSKMQRLTKEFGGDPAFSPDGKTLVYVCDGQGGGFEDELWSLDMASHRKKRLTGYLCPKRPKGKGSALG